MLHHAVFEFAEQHGLQLAALVVIVTCIFIVKFNDWRSIPKPRKHRDIAWFD